MKNKGTTILSVVAALVTVLCITGPAEAGPLARPNLQGGAPTVVSYQGQVTVGGTPYGGTGFFKFAIVDAAGTTTYWSNDGTSSDGGKPTGSVSLTVTDGLFNVLLGDTTLANMTEPLTAAVFDETGRYLRVWFDTEAEGDYLMLSPDRRIAAVPYALQAADADRLDGQHGAYYQARVSGTCPVGSTVRAINADGTVVCQAQAGAPSRAVAPTSNISTTLDGSGNVDGYTSVTIGVDGLPLISYCVSSYLWVAHCDDVSCTSATKNSVAEYCDDYTSITIGVDGLGLISYSDGVAYCDNLACTSATVSTGFNGGMRTSVTIGADGLPLISYWRSGGLWVTHCNDLACISITDTGFGPADLPLGPTSVTIGADGLGLISYDGSRVFHCNNLACTSVTVNTLFAHGCGGYASVAIGADGLPLIGCYDPTNGALKAVHCDDVACTSATSAFLDSPTEDVGLYTSVTIGADGLGLISYYDDTNHDLKVAHCTDLACTSATLNTLSHAGDVVQSASVTIGADGLPLISYHDDASDVLKVAHCGSPLCAPYFRRR